MKFVLITGMSGAGKSIAANCMEDMGYYCVDNLPSELLSKFAEICYQSDSKFDKVAFVIDARNQRNSDDILNEVEVFECHGNKVEILFLDASDETIVKRYKETRRAHPLADGGRIIEGIEKEREILAHLKDRATYVVDTSRLLTRELKENLTELFSGEKRENSLAVNVLSFGFKYGIPNDADLVFDVRFLPNPYYIPELRDKTGLDKDIRDYVNSFPQTKEFAKKLDDMIAFLLPLFIEEGKTQLVIAIGCTGGKHRSVTLASHVYKTVVNLGYKAKITHRDISKGK